MTVVKRTRTLTRAQLAELRQPRADVVLEEQAGPDRWRMVEGPFDRYERSIEVVSGSESIDHADETGTVTVVERTEYRLAVTYWRIYLGLPMRYAIASLDRRPRRRAWWPKEVVASDTARLIGLLATIGAMTGYMGVLIGQTITFAAAEFEVDDAAQADTLAAVRGGVLVSMLLIARADSRGRKPLIVKFTYGAILLTALGAIAPNMLALGGSQALARGLTTGLITLVTLASTEEVPASSRAICIAFMYMATGAGAAVVVWTLPLAGLAPEAWRIIYLVPLLFLPIAWDVARRLPETRRYARAAAVAAPGDIPWKRFALVAVAAFLGAIFLSPASQLRNEFLRDDIGYTAGQISAFQLLVSVPATLAVPIGGYLADRFNRRWVGSIGLTVAALASAASYQATGWRLWLLASIGFSAASAAVPALRGYQTELFPTKARGKVGGFLDVIAVTGSAVGLVIVGRLAVNWDDLGGAIGSLVFAPLVVAVLILVAFPETAGRELEELNPSDPSIEPRAVTGQS